MDHDLELIDLAAARFKYPAVRESAARELGYTPGKFWRKIAVLARRPEIVASRPAETRRLRAMEDARRAVRTAL